MGLLVVLVETLLGLEILVVAVAVVVVVVMVVVAVVVVVVVALVMAVVVLVAIVVALVVAAVEAGYIPESTIEPDDWAGAAELGARVLVLAVADSGATFRSVGCRCQASTTLDALGFRVGSDMRSWLL